MNHLCHCNYIILNQRVLASPQGPNVGYHIDFVSPMIHSPAGLADFQICGNSPGRKTHHSHSSEFLIQAIESFYHPIQSKKICACTPEAELRRFVAQYVNLIRRGFRFQEGMIDQASQFSCTYCACHCRIPITSRATCYLHVEK